MARPRLSLPSGGVVKILAVCHKSYRGLAPTGGADTMIADLMEYLASQGWEASALVFNRPKTSLLVNGVQAHRRSSDTDIWDLFAGTDVVLTHLGGTPTAKSFAGRYKIPVVQLVHNTNEHTTGFLGSGCDMAVYNSEWVRDFHVEKAKHGPIIKSWQGNGVTLVQRRQVKEWPGIVVRPPAMDAPRYGGNPGGKVTLVNLVPNKGPDVFYSLAKANPGIEFLGVVGGYDPEIQVYENHPNVTFHDHTPDVEEFYSQTSVLVVPSRYESYSRVAVEAMARGIPVIASDTPGLKECLADAQPCLPRDGDWSGTLRSVLSDYDEWSRRASDRYAQLLEQTQDDLRRFDQTMTEVGNGAYLGLRA